MADDNRYRDDRYRYRGEDRSRSGGYGREGYRGGERDFSDRASDEVSSWFGDEDAARRRREDERRGGDYGRDYGYGSRSSSGDYDRGGYGRGSYAGDYNRGYGQGGYGYRREGYGGQGDYGREGGYARRGEERGFWDRASDEVSSWFGDEDAARRRREDERRNESGYGSQHRGRGPKGYTRSDDRIREQVCDRLTDDPYVDASDIEVAVSGGEVTLSGKVDSRAARRRAEDIAEQCSGDKHVQNNLRVKQAGSTGAGTTTGTTTGLGTTGASTTDLGGGTSSTSGGTGTSGTSRTGF